MISYYDGAPANQNLKVLSCGNNDCSAGNTITTLDSAGNVGQYTSITVGNDGLGLISYYSVTGGVLKVAHCGNDTCSFGTNYFLDGGSNYSSISVGADGLGIIGLWNGGSVSIDHCIDTACSAHRAKDFDCCNTGSHISLTIGTDGLPLLAYQNSLSLDLKVAHCPNLYCNPNFRRR